MLLNFNLNHVITFVTVAEIGSFRMAADHMNISQSVVSVRIRHLEDRLGVPLFHRTTRSVTLTKEGERLFAVAKGVIADMNRVAAELREEATLHRGIVHVATMPTMAATVLPAAMAKFRAKHPGITLKLVDIDSQRILDLLKYGSIDVGVTADIEMTKNVEFTPLFWDECFFVISRKHPLAHKEVISLADTLEFPLLLSPQGSRFRDVINDAFARRGLQHAPAQEAWNMVTLAALVQQGFGGAFVPRIALRSLDLSRCKVLKLKERTGRVVGVARIANRSESPAAAAFRRFLLRLGTRLADA